MHIFVSLKSTTPLARVAISMAAYIQAWIGRLRSDRLRSSLRIFSCKAGSDMRHPVLSLCPAAVEFTGILYMTADSAIFCSSLVFELSVVGNGL